MLLLLLASGLRGEKAFENALCLPLRGILEINPHVHTARATERGIKSLDVVRGGKQKTKAEDMKLIHEGDGISETHRPSAAATPSRELRRPLRLNVDPSLFSSLFFALDVLDEVEEEELPVGAPVDFSSREMPRVNAASKSSRSRIHRTEAYAGTWKRARSISKFMVESRWRSLEVKRLHWVAGRSSESTRTMDRQGRDLGDHD